MDPCKQCVSRLDTTEHYWNFIYSQHTRLNAPFETAVSFTSLIVVVDGGNAPVLAVVLMMIMMMKIL